MSEPVTYCDIVEEDGLVTVALPPSGLDPRVPTQLVLTANGALEVAQDGTVAARIAPFSAASAQAIAAAPQLLVVEAGEDLTVTVHRDIRRIGFAAANAS